MTSGFKRLCAGFSKSGAALTVGMRQFAPTTAVGPAPSITATRFDSARSRRQPHKPVAASSFLRGSDRAWERRICLFLFHRHDREGENTSGTGEGGRTRAGAALRPDVLTSGGRSVPWSTAGARQSGYAAALGI